MYSNTQDIKNIYSKFPSMILCKLKTAGISLQQVRMKRFG